MKPGASAASSRRSKRFDGKVLPTLRTLTLTLTLTLHHCSFVFQSVSNWSPLGTSSR